MMKGKMGKSYGSKKSGMPKAKEGAKMAHSRTTMHMGKKKK